MEPHPRIGQGSGGSGSPEDVMRLSTLYDACSDARSTPLAAEIGSQLSSSTSRKRFVRFERAAAAAFSAKRRFSDSGLRFRDGAAASSACIRLCKMACLLVVNFFVQTEHPYDLPPVELSMLIRFVTAVVSDGRGAVGCAAGLCARGALATTFRARCTIGGGRAFLMRR